MRSKFVVAACLAVVGAAAALAGNLGTAFTYQGQLKQGGVPVEDPVNLQFDLYDAETGGNLLGSQAIPGVDPTAGLFTVQLDFGAGPFNGQARWLQISVNGTALNPRQRLSATPYALYSTAPWVTNGSSLSYSAGNVGIGTATPASSLGVQGDTRLNGRIAAGNAGQFGPFNPLYDGFFDFSQTIEDFSGREAWTVLKSWNTLNPSVDLTGPNTKSIYGRDLDLAIPGENTHDIDYVQGDVITARTSGTGSVNWLGAGGSWADSSGGGTTQAQVGAWFASTAGADSNNGTIVDNHAANIFSGHYGNTGSVSRDTGLYVYSPFHGSPLDNHYGVYLEDQDFGTNDSYAIYSAGGKSHFNGDVDVTGTLSKGAGSFKIDHPLDPENKYLYHSFVESPDMLNIYNGNVVLDGQGEATVTLPDWFEALNRDFRYQLTCIGGFAPVYIADKIQGNEFRIAGGTPGLEVSWQVTGVRHDPYADAHRIPVEEDKPDYARGSYLHPAEHGKPAAQSVEEAHGQAVGLSKQELPRQLRQLTAGVAGKKR